MTIDEYEKEFPDHMVFYNDNYFSCVDECLYYLSGDYCAEDFTEIHHIYGTDKGRVELDSDNILVGLEENSNLEDWEVDSQGKKDFEEFIGKWNEKYGTDCYMVSDVVILIPDEVKREYLE